MSNAVDSGTLQAYQAILDKMAAATESFSDTAEKLEEQSDIFAEHDNSEAAHPYLQNMIKGINSVTPTDVSATINAHNLASGTHEDIRAELRSISNSATTSAQIVENGIGEHNESSSAHPDIRATLTTHSESLVTVRNNESYIDKLDEIFALLGVSASTGDGEGEDPDDPTEAPDIPSTGIGGSVDDLSLSVAVLTNTVGRHGTEISSLGEDIDFTQSVQIAELNQTDSAMSKRISDLELMVAQLAGGSGATGGVDLTGFKCTIPPVVSAGTDHTVRFEGLIVPDESETVNIEINGASSGFTFSKVANIGLNEDIQIGVPADTTIGIIKSFSVVVTLVNAAASSIMSIPVKINSPPSVSALKHTLPAKVEPGATYKFAISGAKDVDGQTITYSIDITDSTLVFSKTEGIGESEEITATVPSDAVRGHIFTFDIIATDELGASTSKLVEGGEVNIVPNTSGMEHTVPAVIKPGTTYYVTFGGATSADNSSITYGVKPLDENSPLSFSEQANILPGARILLSSDTTDSQRGQSFDVEITATDQHGATSSITTTVKINQLPTADTVVTSIPAAVTGGTTLSGVTISGGLDVDGGDLTYSITAVSSILGFSKTKNIKANEPLTVTVPLMLAATPMQFEVQVTDSVGEHAMTPKVITVTVEPKLATIAPQVLYPENGQTNIPFGGFTILVSEYETEVDL